MRIRLVIQTGSVGEFISLYDAEDDTSVADFLYPGNMVLFDGLVDIDPVNVREDLKLETALNLNTDYKAQ